MEDVDVCLPAYFGYIGSKSTFVPELQRRLPPEARMSYCEPFAGGVGAFLGLPKARIAILNDLDPDPIETHQCVAAFPAEVMIEMERLRPSRLEFDRIRKLRETAAWHELSPARRAACFIYLIKCSVNGNMRSFSNSSKARSTFNPHYDLTAYARKFEGVTFENLAWRELIDRLVFKPKEVRLFLYLDPPYVTSDTEKHYRFNFDRVEHLMLARALARINTLNDGSLRSVKVMLSYDDDDGGYIRSLYRPEFGWRVETIRVNYASEHRSNRCRNELLIMNYDPPSSSPSASERAAMACGEVEEGTVAMDYSLDGADPIDAAPISANLEMAGVLVHKHAEEENVK